MNKIEYEYLEQAVAQGGNRPVFTWGHYIKVAGNQYAVAADGYLMNIVRDPSPIDRDLEGVFYPLVKFADSEMGDHIHITKPYVGIMEKCRIDPEHLKIFTNDAALENIFTDGWVRIVVDGGWCYAESMDSEEQWLMGKYEIVGDFTEFDVNTECWRFRPDFLRMAVHPSQPEWIIHLNIADKNQPAIIRADRFSSIVMPLQHE